MFPGKEPVRACNGASALCWGTPLWLHLEISSAPSDAPFLWSLTPQPLLLSGGVVLPLRGLDNSLRPASYPFPLLCPQPTPIPPLPFPSLPPSPLPRATRLGPGGGPAPVEVKSFPVQGMGHPNCPLHPLHGIWDSERDWPALRQHLAQLHAPRARELSVCLVKPAPPANLTIQNISNNQLQLTWDSVYNKPHCLEYAVRYKSNKDTRWTEHLASGKIFSFPSVDYEKYYTFNVKSKISQYCGTTQLWSEWSVPVFWGNNCISTDSVGPELSLG
uniref:Fibronectin type-III domain-containing protein n=1 Tax=Terrapene triunguis TaxID=2587831 RepID=A0A674JSI7_9SAUR